MIGTVADITPQKVSEQQIKDSEARFRSLFEHLPIAYQSLDHEGHWLDANMAMAELLGYADPHEMIGCNFGVHFQDADSGQFQKNYALFKKENYVEREIPLLRKDGQHIEALISGRIQRDAKGHFIRTHCILVDVTERRERLRASEAKKEELEQRVRQRTQDLEDALTMRSRFLAHMSHEIRNPMNIIAVNTHLIERTPLTDQQKNMIQRTRRASSVMLSFLDEVLDYSRLEAGEITLETSPFTLDDVLNGVILLQGAAAETKGLEIHQDCDARLKGEWLGDTRRIEQVLINLTSNAIKFTDKRSISVRTTCLDESPKESLVRFDVTDTGSGIEADQLPSLFEPFKQTNHHHASHIKGTGLGLSISKGLVELMGGAMGVSSTPGIGSSFWFTLPLQKTSREPTHETSHPDKEALCYCRVLLVDDDPEHRNTLRMLLESAGAQCAEASNGHECLLELKADPKGFHAVLMDVQMPIMDGIAATEYVRKQMHLPDLPIIAITGGLTPEQQDKSMQSGMTYLLKKPVAPEELLNLLRKYCPC